MKNKIFFLAGFLCTILLFSVCSAEIPHLINYQGKITDKDNRPLDGAYNIVFKLYSTSTAGQVVWQEPHTGVIVQKGLVSITLGSVQTLKNVPFDKPYFLEIQVNNEILSPRQEVTSVAYAKRAEKADNIAITGQQQGDILYFDGTKWVSLVAGTKGQVLQTQGPGTSPVWIEPSFQNMQVFNVSGVFKKPLGVDKVYVQVIGGGGSGTKYIYGGGSGGGAGGYSEKVCTITGDVIVTVGTGGSNSSNGGSSSFGNFCIATGGYAGINAIGGIGGIGTGGDINLAGGNGGSGGQFNGGHRVVGGGGGGGKGYSEPGSGISYSYSMGSISPYPYCAGGDAVTASEGGINGRGYGGGGSGTPGSGASGVVIVKW
ncbi:MAG: hypothetical protein WCY12_00300 [Candidatus Omnitrophota bacterium]